MALYVKDEEVGRLVERLAKARRQTKTEVLRQVLQKEIENLKMELDLRRELSSNSPMAIIERGKSRAENSRSIYQAAPETNRLQQLQSPAGKE